ncbi:MAG TPA: LCP family protein [Pseudonocardiaceae bacterium]|nr:LCP family protein [Pseudonocardiaceae bacterium]
MEDWPRQPRDANAGRPRQSDDYRARPGGPRRPPPSRARRPPGYRPSSASASASARAAARSRARAWRTALAVVSAVVLGVTAYGWSTVDKLTAGLTTANVIDPAAEGDSGPQNILLVGLDTRTDAQGHPLPKAELATLHAGPADEGADGTDTMIVVHIPAGGGRAVGFSIPRDSYVRLAGGYGMHKINSAYTYADNAAARQLRDQGLTGPTLVRKAAEAGARNAIDTVEQFTGLKINHYASVNLVGFYDISNAIGGVQVCVKRATHDFRSGANFHAGVQTVKGAQALAYVRQRHDLPDGDLDRVKRQQAFLAAMAHRVLSAGVLTHPSQLNGLIAALQKSITLSSGWNILNFAQQLQGLSAGAIQFYTIPVQNIAFQTPSDGSAVEVDPGQVQSFVQTQVGRADNPAPPAAPTTHAPKPTTPARSNATITTQVYNTTSIQGLAKDVLESLTSKGFVSGGTGNSTARSATVIDYAPGDQASARQVATALGDGSIQTASSTLVSPGTVRVYLGANYSGPKGAAATATTPATAKAAPPPITGAAANCIY